MLQPTSISVYLGGHSQYKKINFSDVKVDVDPVFLKLDFKDMDLVYYLISKQTKEY
jgi:hypothetical protein